MKHSPIQTTTLYVWLIKYRVNVVCKYCAKTETSVHLDITGPPCLTTSHTQKAVNGFG